MGAAVVGAVVALAVLGRYLYCHLAPHGSIICARARDCAAAGGGHVLCNCGATSPHYQTWDLLSAHRWRKAHRSRRR
jgi:hypothetical protein